MKRRLFFLDGTCTVRVKLFGGIDEKINLAIPFIGFAAIAWEWWSGHQYTLTEQNGLSFVCRVIFLNYVHSLFSAATVILVPEVNSWFRDRLRRDRWLIPRWLFYFFVTFWVTFLGENYLPSYLIGLILFFSSYHILAQVFGMSLLYNRELENSIRLAPQERAKSRSLESGERWLSRMIVPSLAIVVVGRHSILESLIWIVVGFSMLSALGCVWIAARSPRSSRSNKIWFAFRYLAIPLFAVSTAARSLLLAMHGIEYLFVTKKIWRSSGMPAAKRRWAVPAAVMGIGVVLLLTIPGQGLLGFMFVNRLSNTTIDALGAFSFAYTILHVCFDHQFFKMRDAQTRARVLPLIMTKQQNPVEPTDLNSPIPKVQIGQAPFEYMEESV